jgi:hypothetical protein
MMSDARINCRMKLASLALAAACLSYSGGALAEKTPCPPRTAGQAYPWQDLTPMKGDSRAVVHIDVDQSGRPLRCGLGKNDISDPETRFRVCKTYMEDWRAPPAEPGQPSVRTITTNFTMLGYEHQMADRKARRLWFKQNPHERSECYPE